MKNGEQQPFSKNVDFNVKIANFMNLKKGQN
jgi:hypothetical protein